MAIRLSRELFTNDEVKYMIGTTVREFLRGTDLSRIPENIASLYNDGTENLGNLFHQPQKLNAPSLPRK